MKKKKKKRKAFASSLVGEYNAKLSRVYNVSAQVSFST